MYFVPVSERFTHEFHVAGGHCKRLAPVWEELAKKYGADNRVIVAKMDATANEVERVLVTGFPTLKFFPKDSWDVVDYNGERELGALSAFLDEQLEK